MTASSKCRAVMSRLTAGPWPMSDIHSLDLFRVLQRHLSENDGIELTLVGMPLWLQADSHSLILALEHLVRAVANYTGKSAFDIEALPGTWLCGGRLGGRAGSFRGNRVLAR